MDPRRCSLTFGNWCRRIASVPCARFAAARIKGWVHPPDAPVATRRTRPLQPCPTQSGHPHFPVLSKKCQTINVTCNSLKKLLEHLSIGTLFMACNSFICLLTFRKRTRILFRPNLHSIYLEHNSIIQVHTAFDQCEIWRNFLRFGFVLFLDIGPLYSFNIFFQRNSQKDDRYGHWHNFRWLLIKKMKNDVGFFYSFKFEYFTYFSRYLINLSRRPPTTTSQR